jgi:hypothetical protein
MDATTLSIARSFLPSDLLRALFHSQQQHHHKRETRDGSECVSIQSQWGSTNLDHGDFFFFKYKKYNSGNDNDSTTATSVRHQLSLPFTTLLTDTMTDHQAKKMFLCLSCVRSGLIFLFVTCAT